MWVWVKEMLKKLKVEYEERKKQEEEGRRQRLGVHQVEAGPHGAREHRDRARELQPALRAYPALYGVMRLFAELWPMLCAVVSCGLYAD